MEGNRSRLNSFYQPDQAGTVTPRQIVDRINDPDGSMEPQDIFNLMPPEIKDRFKSRIGNVKEEDLKRFLKSLGNFMGDYKVQELLQISEDCIDKKGRIVESKLKEILADEGED